MLMRKTAALLVTFLLLPSLALASVSCDSCKVGDCTCVITDCDSGILDIFSASSCSITPSYEYTFSAGSLKWNPPTSRTYYVKALCSDGETQSDCFAVTVKSAQATTTTTKPKATTTTTLPAAAPGPDYTLFALVAVLIAAILSAVWYLFLRKKKGGTYEEIYRKWKK